MYRTFRFRLHPAREQEHKLLVMIEAGRRLWNNGLEHRMRRWNNERLSTSYRQQSALLVEYAQAEPLIKELYAQSAQAVLKRLDEAFEAFFGRRAKYPKFKRFSNSGSFTYPQAYSGSVKPDPTRKRIFLSKVGNVKAVFHRTIPEEKPKTCTVVRERDGEWYVCLVYDEDIAPQTVDAASRTHSPVGIDLGLKSLITTSDGNKILHPHLLLKAEKRLKRLQRRLSRKQKGSRNRERARLLLAVQSSKVSRQREDFNHKLSAELVEKHDFIFLEDLNVAGLVKNHVIAKSIHDAGWSQLVSFMGYKSRRAGKVVIKVSAAYSTQECFFCGTLNPIPLSVRQIECAGCGRVLDRDINAARIVLKRGIAKVGQDKVPSEPRSREENPCAAVPELKPVEAGPLPTPTTERASQVEEAGTTRGRSHATGEPAAGRCHDSFLALPTFPRLVGTTAGRRTYHLSRWPFPFRTYSMTGSAL